MNPSEMYDTPRDAEPSARSARILSTYRTAIGDAIFSGDDFQTLRLRSDFSEMLLCHLKGGGMLGLSSIVATLAEFTPQRVSTTTHPVWKIWGMEEWEQHERPRIFAAIEAFFLDGSLERRMEEQRTLFIALQAAGIQFGDDSQLIARVLRAGDWRKTFVDLTMMGRGSGIRLSGNKIDRPSVTVALNGAGFSREQQHHICCNLHEIDSSAGCDNEGDA